MIGVLSLPFHLMFAVTGALLCLVFIQIALLNPLIFEGKALQAVPTAMDTAPVRAPPAACRPLRAACANCMRARWKWHARRA